MKPEPLTKPQILIVDDEKENLTGFKYLFDDIYEVYTAESADEGKRILERQNIQVVISDQRMPQKTGVEFLQEVLKDHPDTVRMILTGYSDFDAVIDAINKGQIYYYFTKPWQESEMKMIINNALEALGLIRKLKQSEECFRQLSENIREVFWLVSPDWADVYYVSAAYAGIFNKSPDILYENPLHWLELVHPEDREQVQTMIDQAGGSLDEELVFPEFRILREDMSVRWISFKIFPVCDQNNAVYRYAGLMEDITENKQTIEMLIQSEKMISMGGLAAGIAHELNNPLSGIIQGTQLIEQRFSEDLKKNQDAAAEVKVDLSGMKQYMEKRSVTRILESIKESGLRASRIISDMLSISRRSDSRKGEAYVHRILDNIVNIARSDYDLKKKYDFKSIDIVKEVDESLPPIFCNETEIGQVILNLLKNAAQALNTVAGDEQPTITLRVEAINDKVRVEIEDNGPGMDESIQSRVFEPFFTTKKKEEGTGLGLSISKKIITLNHKGSISVKSKPGKGSTFTILLPFYPDKI